ncbi:sensor histidine kinase [Roseateles sp. NT4]|uniref:sensor histidine kinase n=1 Tax=Roseateles sp. NT4 TaxID=3453715 RepID=UPI003EEC06D6
MLLIRFALGFSLFETLVLAGVLLWWSDRVAGGRLLATFLVGIAVWITGNELPNWWGPAAEPVALRLVSMAPFVSTFFFHFCVVFCRVPLGRVGVATAYGLGALASLCSLLGHPGHLTWSDSVGWIFVAGRLGWMASVAWIILGIAGVAVLLRGLALAKPPARQQIAAVTASCLWGLLCLSGYGLVLLQVPVFPVPLLLLPLYPVILVYGVLRWGVFVANAWAGRALVWTLLLAVGVGIVGLMPLLLPFESRWLSGVAVAAGCLALSGPVRRFVQRLIYPGGEASAADLQAWREALLPAETLAELGGVAGQLLSRRLGTPVEVVFDAEGAPTLPRLNCRRAPWRLQLDGWSAAPPGQRHLAELFASLVLEAAVRVEQAQQLAARERERQLQARLAELGALAATVAHDIRNPLNIISMAVATADSDTRREVAGQVDRIAHLTRDLLDYAKPWKLSTAEVDVTELVRRVTQRTPEAELGAGLQHPLPALLDARRVEQALTNLVENGRTAGGGAVHVDAERDADGLRLHVCDNGPGVPEAIRERLFEPFASRSPGGTGLGLAIVARVMSAHGGTAALTERPGWRTCFTLSFPHDPIQP